MKPDPGAGTRPVHGDADEPPPLLGSWPRLYAAVVLYVIALILALYWVNLSLNR